MAENPKYKLIGQNYVLPDLVAKVTGRAKYSEDFRADGMLFAKLLLSPLPHARIRRVDASAALAMPGVVAVITGEDIPKPQQPMQLGEAAAQRANTLPEVALATEPLYQGEPIVAVAAIDEVTAADAIEKIKVDYEPLPFVVDPMVTLRPGGPNPRAEGNVWRPPQVQEMKITAADVAELDAGRVPLLENTPIRWQVGDVDAGFKNADYILDETIVHQSTGHQPMEPRTAMAYWQNGKLYLHGSTQSVARTVANVAQWVDIPQDRRGRHQRVHRRRVRRQDSWRADDGDSGDSVEEDRPSRDDAHHARRRELHRPRARGHSPAREDRLPQGRPHPRDGFVRDRRLRSVLESGRRRHARLERDGALQSRKHSLPRRGRAHQHSAARLAARARRRAGRRDARADDQQGRAPPRRRPGRDSQDQRARHRIGIRTASAAGRRRCGGRCRRSVGCARGCAGRTRLPSRSRSRSNRGARLEEGRRLRDRCRVSSLWLPRHRLRHRSVRFSRAATCAKRSIWARSCSSGTSARPATASASERRSRASASASAPTRPARLRWTDCCWSAPTARSTCTRASAISAPVP